MPFMAWLAYSLFRPIAVLDVEVSLNQELVIAELPLTYISEF